GRATRPSSLAVGEVIGAEVAAAVEETKSRPATAPASPAWRTVPVAKAAYPPPGAENGATAPAGPGAPESGPSTGASSEPASSARAAVVDATAMTAATATARRARCALPWNPMIRPGMTTEGGNRPCGPVCSTPGRSAPAASAAVGRKGGVHKGRRGTERTERDCGAPGGAPQNLRVLV